MQPGTQLYAISLSIGGLPRYFFTKIARLTPSGKARLENGDLGTISGVSVRTASTLWTLYDEEARTAYRAARRAQSLRRACQEVGETLVLVGAGRRPLPTDSAERARALVLELQSLLRPSP